jgi:predicted Fe-S protein YdhL (DUF1289 family)
MIIDHTHNNIESPCVGQCRLDDKDMCVGCFRMMDEILSWGQVDDKQKQKILIHCKTRKRNT